MSGSKFTDALAIVLQWPASVLRFRFGGNCIGALAQLGEHLLCKQGVIGSIPIGSTKHLIILKK